MQAEASEFTGTGQEVSLQVIIGYLIVTTMEWLKERQWFPWLTPHTAKLNRAVGAAAAFLYSIGIHYQFDSAAGMLVISGLSMEPIIDGLRGFVMQQLMYRGAIEKPILEAAAMKKTKQRKGKKLGTLLLVGALSFGTMACGGKVPLQTDPTNPVVKRTAQQQVLVYADVIQRAGEIIEQGQLIEIAAYKDGHIPQATHVAFQQRLLTASRAVQTALDRAKQFAKTPDIVTILKTALDVVDVTLSDDIARILNVGTKDKLAAYFNGLRSLLDALIKIPSLEPGGDLSAAEAVWQRIAGTAALAQ